MPRAKKAEVESEAPKKASAAKGFKTNVYLGKYDAEKDKKLAKGAKVDKEKGTINIEVEVKNLKVTLNKTTGKYSISGVAKVPDKHGENAKDRNITRYVKKEIAEKYGKGNIQEVASKPKEGAKKAKGKGKSCTQEYNECIERKKSKGKGKKKVEEEEESEEEESEEEEED